MEVLKLQNLSKYYTTQSSVVMGLSEVSLSFSIGEFVAITGESGSGKSTLAHVLGGILPYESGELSIYGEPTSHYTAKDWEEYRRDLISFISQNYGILAGNTVQENVVSALLLSGLSKDDADLRADEILAEVELSELKTRRAEKLSSGQKQRLSIARALAKPSKILIADEPTGNLDRENSDKVIKLLKKASEERLVILITHEFEEAKDVATRRIVLSDGKVVSDAKLRDANTPGDVEKRHTPPTKKKKQPFHYVTGLAIKSRPVFSAIVCLFLALTTLMTFVFLGNFIIAVDDTGTRIYESDAFANGSPDRIVVMKSDRSPFTEEDYAKILKIKYTESIETRGYVTDISCHYRPDIDYQEYQDILFGPNYHPVLNPGDYQLTNKVKFYEEGVPFLRTVPKTRFDFIKKGRAAEGFYEVVSADPDYKVGDTVKVFIRNTTQWGRSVYYSVVFDVVGETSHGDGLYFSDDFGAMMTRSVISSQDMCPAPFDASKYTLTNEITVLDDDEFILPDLAQYSKINVGSSLLLNKGGKTETMYCASKFETAFPKLMLVSESSFTEMIDKTPSNQISLFIKDYAYTDRVLDSLADKGYVAVSPFRIGATQIDPELAKERIVTLSVCIGAIAVTLVLQLILLRAMFSSLNEYFRLLSNIGLARRTAESGVKLLFLIYTVIGEAVGFAVIAILNGLQIDRICNIFKYFDTIGIILLIGVHIISVIPSLMITIKSLRQSVFPASSKDEDLDFSLMEERAV